MKKPKFVTGEEAAAMIKDDSTIATIGMTLVSASETILKAIEKRFLETGSPNHLTLVHSCGQSDRDRGIQHFSHEEMLYRIIGGHWGLQPRMMKLISENKILAYCIPQGQFAQLYRSMAGGEPGKITKVGLGTFIDPRIDGGKMNAITKDAPDIVDVVTIDGEEYMRYKPIPLDYCIIRGTYVDEMGNLTTDEEAMQLEVFSAVMACKKFGGKVIAQAKYKVKSGTLHCKRVTVPGIFIDAVVMCPNPEEDHRQTHSFAFDPAYCLSLIHIYRKSFLKSSNNNHIYQRHDRTKRNISTCNKNRSSYTDCHTNRTCISGNEGSKKRYTQSTCHYSINPKKYYKQ